MELGEPGLRPLVEELRDASDGWSGDAACVSAEVAARGADEIERLRYALEIIARDPGGIPGPRVFARDVLDGNIVLNPPSREAAATNTLQSRQ